jgi:membrane dipeptidase
MPQSVPPEAAAVHAAAPVLLSHVHMQRAYRPEAIDYVAPADDLPGRQVDLPKLRRGGVKFIWLSEGAPGEYAVDAGLSHRAKLDANVRPATRIAFRGGTEAQRLVRGWDAVRRLCADHPADLAFARSVKEARAAAGAGRVAVFWHTESLLLANDLAVLRAYHGLGLRATGLVHAAPLDWIDSDKEQRTPGGLTAFGREVLRELNALGIVVDVSHASEAAIADVVRLSRHPVVASHSNVRRLAPVRRNLTDEAIRAIAGGGGVIGIHCSSALIDAGCLEGRRGLARPKLEQFSRDAGERLAAGTVDPFWFEGEYREREAWEPGVIFPTTDLARLVDHVDALVDLVGVDHVGVGTDFHFLEDVVRDFEGVHQTPNLTAALLARGYPAPAVTKILGGNFLRVMATVIGE